MIKWVHRALANIAVSKLKLEYYYRDLPERDLLNPFWDVDSFKKSNFGLLSLAGLKSCLIEAPFGHVIGICCRHSSSGSLVMDRLDFIISISSVVVYVILLGLDELFVLSEERIWDFLQPFDSLGISTGVKLSSHLGLRDISALV
jgi:hypothetical protein